mmetsp:Transcript_41691/g.97922  ORF Transcript_41691/g.97922 Transcript_41691/m.97922 type:complete len:955 (+) Transcript_41691:51-2915(+)
MARKSRKTRHGILATQARALLTALEQKETKAWQASDVKRLDELKALLFSCIPKIKIPATRADVQLLIQELKEKLDGRHSVIDYCSNPRLMDEQSAQLVPVPIPERVQAAEYTMFLTPEDIVQTSFPQHLTDIIFDSPEIGNLQVLGSLNALSCLQRLTVTSRAISEGILPLGQLSSLRTLRLTNTKMSRLSGNMPPNLENLDLRHNKFTEIPSVVNLCETLSSLVLEHNELGQPTETIASEVDLSKLSTKLNRLALKENTRMTQIPASIQRFKHLRAFGCSRCRLQDISAILCADLVGLECLSVYNNELTSIPETLSMMTNLLELQLDNNRLVSLPDVFSHLTRLHRFSIFNNKLQELPETIGELKQLTRMSFADNKLKGLPDSIRGLTKLYALDLSDNNMAAIPRGVCELSGLFRLDMRYNKLETLNREVSGLHELEVLDVSRNKIVDCSAVNQLTNLKILRLRHNFLSAKPFPDLPNLTKLRIVDLGENNILPFTLLSIQQRLTNHKQKLPWAHRTEVDVREIDVNSQERWLSAMTSEEIQLATRHGAIQQGWPLPRDPPDARLFESAIVGNSNSGMPAESSKYTWSSHANGQQASHALHQQTSCWSRAYTWPLALALGPDRKEDDDSVRCRNQRDMPLLKLDKLLQAKSGMRLDVVDLSGMGLTDCTVLQQLQSVRILDVSRNLLTEFYAPPSVEILHFEHNLLSLVDARALDQCSRLEELYLSCNRLKVLSFDFGEEHTAGKREGSSAEEGGDGDGSGMAESMEEAGFGNMSEAGGEGGDDAMLEGDESWLRQMCVSDGQRDQMDEGSRQDRAHSLRGTRRPRRLGLVQLHLGENQLCQNTQALLQGLVHWDLLRILRLEKNDLRDQDVRAMGIGKCKFLVELDLRYNKLTRLPDALTKLLNLKGLYLSQNPIQNDDSEIDLLIRKLPRLKFFSIKESKGSLQWQITPRG